MNILKAIPSIVGLTFFSGFLTINPGKANGEDRPAIVRTPQGGGINKGNVRSETARPQFSEGFGPKGLRGIGREGLVFVRTSEDNDKAQTLALEAAVKSYLNRKDLNDTTSLKEFVDRYPSGPWCASVNVTLGVHCYREGRFSEALALFESAWKGLKDSSDPEVRKASVAAAAELAALYSRLGRVEDLKLLLDEVNGRPISGPATEKLRMAAQGLHSMLNHPEHSFKCGPYALRVIRDYLELDPKAHPSIEQKASTIDGIPLSEVQQLASEMGMDWVAVVRAPGAELPLPAVVHWKVGHYAAVLKRLDDGRLLVRDATFLNDFLIEPAVFDEQASGYFLVPRTALGNGISALSAETAATVFGKGAPNSQDDHDCPRPEKDCPKGMAVYSFDYFKAGLVIEDIPVGYKPPFGPAIDFHLTYNQRGLQVLDSSTSSFGPKWSLNWLSYIELDDESGNVKAFLKDGRMERHSIAAMGRGAAAAYGQQRCSHTQMIKIPDTPSDYERRHPDGTVETFGREVPGTPTSKILLTQITDPQGNSVSLTYDSSNRLIGVTDALGQTSTLYYENLTYPHLVTKISDPFVVGGQRRSATFEYDTSGRLIKITDVIGIESQFRYEDSVQTDFVTKLITPYGTTSFTTNSSVSYVDSYFVEVTDPLGRKERVEYRHVSNLPASDPSGELPQGSGVQTYNAYLYYGNTFYWDKKTYGHFPPNPETRANYDKAVIRKWMWDSAVGFRTTGVIGSIKKPFESRIWYQYPGQTIGTWGISLGDKERPSLIARRVSPSETQIDRFQHNDKGLITEHIDTTGRTRVWEYDSNDVDLISVKQKNGSNFETLQSFSYDPSDPPRRPRSITDAAGQTTTISWNARGQSLSMTQPGSLTTSLQYNTAGYLTSLDGPLTGTADTFSYTYDGYGRTRTTTEPGGYTLTYDYDVLDRPTLVTYPDSTTEQFSYQRSSNQKILDLTHYKDREDRWTLFAYNALGERVSTLDPLLRTTLYNWCYCGDLQDIYDGEGNRIHWSYDIGGRLIKKRYTDGTEHLYAYDLAGRLSTITDAKGQIKTYSYYPDGRFAGVAYTNSENPTANVSYTYDSAYGRLSQMTDGVGTTTYTYHPVDGSTFGAGALHTEDGPFNNDTIAYTYDALGRLESRMINGSANSVTVDSYDALGRVTSLTNPLGTFTQSYDPVTLALKTVTAPNGSVTSYSYLGATADLRLEEIKHAHSSSSVFAKHTYSYTPAGNITSWGQTASGSPDRQWSFDYDRADQLKAATLKEAAAPFDILGHQAWVYDRAGNRLSFQNGSQVTKGTFNNLNQLVGETGGGKIRVHGKTDEPATVAIRSNSNAFVSAVTGTSNHFTAWVDVEPGANTITVEAKDISPNSNTNTSSYQVVVTTPGASRPVLEYDLNGNLIDDGTRTFEWDAENRLVAINQSGNARTEFTYDGQSRWVRLVEKTNGDVTSTKNLVWAGLAVAEERDGSNVVTKRYYPQGVQVGSASYFYTRDHLGSIRELTDSAEVVQARYDYDPYGRRTKVTGSIDADFGFTGHYEHVASGLTLAPYRAYDSTLGRWISRDPIQEMGGLNLYRYVENNSINSVDLTGLKSQQCESLKRSIRNKKADIQKRIGEMAEDRLGLPWRAPGDVQKPSLSRWGHLKLINMLKADLAADEALYKALECDKDDDDNQPKKCPSSANAAVKVGAGVAGGYLLYRGIRMLPSVALPPLWPTIPVNAAVP